MRGVARRPAPRAPGTASALDRRTSWPSFAHQILCLPHIEHDQHQIW